MEIDLEKSARNPAATVTVETKRHYLAVNRERLRRVQSSMPQKQRPFLEILPLLFHTNHPELPGYISEQTPYGLSDYKPTQAALQHAKHLNKSFRHNLRALREYPIYSIFLMGSSGTIGYSQKSDLDIWICVRPGMAAKHRALLQRKGEAIQLWAMKEMSIETHFFIMDPKNFRTGADDSATQPEDQNAQHHLLLEEFYRTSLLVAGRFPVWWLVTREQEENYEETIQALVDNGIVDQYEYIDFGALGNIPAHEFFNTAVWQLHKAVNSPNKSILKILLAEAYASEYPHTELVCHQLKKAIHAGETGLLELDSYALMMKKVETYLQENGDIERLDLARRCFYYKSEQPLSRVMRRRSLSYEQESLKTITKNWGWDINKLEELDHRHQWRLDKIIGERNAIVQYLTQSYRALTHFTREHAEAAQQHNEELTILGRKLYSVFERKAGKIDLLNLDTGVDVRQSQLSFEQITSLGQEGWLLYDTTHTSSQPRNSIKRAYSLLELLAWAEINHVITRNTALSISSKDENLSRQEFQALSYAVHKIFDQYPVTEATYEELSEPEQIQHAACFINIGINPIRDIFSENIEIISDQNDAFHYSHLGINLVRSIDMLYTTSWQQVFVVRYTGPNAIFDCISDYLSWFPMYRGKIPHEVECHCFSSSLGSLIAKRLENLFKSTIQHFYQERWHFNSRFILQTGKQLHEIQPENGVPKASHFNSYFALRDHLAEPQQTFSPIKFDYECLQDAVLPIICEKNAPEKIQLFVQSLDHNKADVYILDEKGSLFYQQCPMHSLSTLIDAFRKFIESAIQRINHLNLNIQHVFLDDVLEIYEVSKTVSGQHYIQTSRWQDNMAFHAFAIQVLGDISEKNKNVFSIFCDKEEISSLEYGRDIFNETAKRVISRRQSGGTYPIYVTDIDLSRSFVGAASVNEIQTIHLLNYKKWIEKQLNQAIESLNGQEHRNEQG